MRTRPSTFVSSMTAVVLVEPSAIEPAAEREPGVVDEDVDAAEALGRVSDERLRALLVRHVERRRDVALAGKRGEPPSSGSTRRAPSATRAPSRERPRGLEPRSRSRRR